MANLVMASPRASQSRFPQRGELLAATERELEAVARATTRARRPPRGRDEIGLRVGRVINHDRVGKHFVVEIADSSFHCDRDQSRIVRDECRSA